MSSSINKIHLNNMTRISLNDRFTIMKTMVPAQTAPAVQNRGRSRSRSRSRTRTQNVTRGSVSNCKLVEELDRKHKMEAAFQLKKTNMKPARQRPAAARNPLNQISQFLMPTRRNEGRRRLNRSNSLSNVEICSILNAELMRRNARKGLAGRLGVRPNSSPQQQRGRRLNRSNSVSNMNRSNSRSRLSRSNSRQNLNQNQNRGRSRSRSRGRVSMVQQQAPQPVRRRLNRASFRSSTQNLPVQSRLGVINNNNNNNNNSNKKKKLGTARVAGGKIVKRTQTGRVGGGDGRRAGRAIKKGKVATQGGRQPVRKGRGVNNGTKKGLKGQGKQGTAPAGKRKAGGVAKRLNANNKGNRGNRRSIPKKNPKSKEDLDKELDHYMSTNKSDINLYM